MKWFFGSAVFAKAEAELKLAVAADEDGSIYYLLGNVYRKLGRQREADEAFETMNRIKQAKLKETQQRAERSMQKEAR
ncbi:MAG: hypothetical protein L0387_21870 [Acidobacteria bacterium]|nr:hypothetical protein [Acidobacteriota bacterium]